MSKKYGCSTAIFSIGIISNLLSGVQMIALFYLFKHRREKAEAKLVAQQPVKEKKLNYNQIEKIQREQAEAERLAEKKAKEDQNKK